MLHNMGVLDVMGFLPYIKNRNLHIRLKDIDTVDTIDISCLMARVSRVLGENGEKND